MIKDKLYELIHKQPYGTKEVIDINKIKITWQFEKTQPKWWKMVRARERYLKKGFLDEPITIHIMYGEYILVDGYTRYLVAKESKLTKVPVKYT